MDLEKLQLSQFADLSRWREIKRVVGKRQLLFRIGHLNPEVNIDPVYGQSNRVIKEERRGNVIETTSTVGISTKKGSMTDFYEAMIGLANMGFLPGFSVEKIEKLRRDINKEQPEECDFWSDINVAKFQDEKTAAQSLENYVNQFSIGLANSPVPGADNMTLVDVFNNPAVKEAAQKQGVSEEKMAEALEKIKAASAQAVRQVADSGVVYKKGDFRGYPAVYFYPPPAKKNPESKKPAQRENKMMTGGGGSDQRVKFPKDAFKKEDLPIDGRFLQAFQVREHLFTGGLLTTLNCMPTGKTFCQSLTKFETKTQTSRDGGMTLIDHFIIPLNSCLEQEGYLHREETERMVLKLISLL
ncbi:MAG: hypothetical protein ACOYJ8_02390 [Patescibacteria group bacterium]|jgi:hypothetical protein